MRRRAAMRHRKKSGERKNEGKCKKKKKRKRKDDRNLPAQKPDKTIRDHEASYLGIKTRKRAFGYII